MSQNCSWYYLLNISKVKIADMCYVRIRFNLVFLFK